MKVLDAKNDGQCLNKFFRALKVVLGFGRVFESRSLQTVAERQFRFRSCLKL